MGNIADSTLEGYSLASQSADNIQTKKPMSNEHITIGEILEMQPGDKDNPCWINSNFTATISAVTQRQTQTGAAMFTGTFRDPDTGTEIIFSAFGRKAFPPSGTLVNVGGQGLSLGTYKGAAQLTIGQKVIVSIVAGRVATPAPSTAQAPAQAPAQHAARAPAAASGPYLGVTVGMAINNACNLAARFTGTNDSEDFVNRYIYRQASALLRIGRALEAGRLVPTAKERANDTMPGDPEENPAEEEVPAPRAAQPPPPARRAVPQPQPAFREGDTGVADGEDVPFNMAQR